MLYFVFAELEPPFAERPLRALAVRDTGVGDLRGAVAAFAAVVAVGSGPEDKNVGCARS
ncbi:hypothetical protein [Subtercola sp. Z020]|uniref:hypothetical protein n=1 Tax=Subtercola sp. Z020 TaxID=2080582 RepID=UPI00130D9A9F|nr:hypothetical protein [Subtercola sp. Z020]